MEDVMNYLKDVDWDGLGKLFTDFVNEMDIPGFFTTCVNFVQELFEAIFATAA